MKISRDICGSVITLASIALLLLVTPTPAEATPKAAKPHVFRVLSSVAGGISTKMNSSDPWEYGSLSGPAPGTFQKLRASTCKELEGSKGQENGPIIAAPSTPGGGCLDAIVPSNSILLSAGDQRPVIVRFVAPLSGIFRMPCTLQAAHSDTLLNYDFRVQLNGSDKPLFEIKLYGTPAQLNNVYPGLSFDCTSSRIHLHKGDVLDFILFQLRNRQPSGFFYLNVSIEIPPGPWVSFARGNLSSPPCKSQDSALGVQTCVSQGYEYFSPKTGERYRIWPTSWLPLSCENCGLTGYFVDKSTIYPIGGVMPRHMHSKVSISGFRWPFPARPSPASLSSLKIIDTNIGLNKSCNDFRFDMGRFDPIEKDFLIPIPANINIHMVRLQGRYVNADPGTGVKVYMINRDLDLRMTLVRGDGCQIGLVGLLGLEQNPSFYVRVKVYRTDPPYYLPASIPELSVHPPPLSVAANTFPPSGSWLLITFTSGMASVLGKDTMSITSPSGLTYQMEDAGASTSKLTEDLEFMCRDVKLECPFRGNSIAVPLKTTVMAWAAFTERTLSK